MHFQLSHDVEAPLGAVEQAVLSPELGAELQERLPGIRSVETVEHVQRGEVLHRIMRFQARRALGRWPQGRITDEMMTWDEHSIYRLSQHLGEWFVVPRPAAEADAPWRRRFHSAGTYQLASLDDRATRRSVAGDMDIRMPLIGPALERLALVELRRTLAAEADALRSLSTRS